MRGLERNLGEADIWQPWLARKGRQLVLIDRDYRLGPVTRVKQQIASAALEWNQSLGATNPQQTDTQQTDTQQTDTWRSMLENSLLQGTDGQAAVDYFQQQVEADPDNLRLQIQLARAHACWLELETAAAANERAKIVANGIGLWRTLARRLKSSSPVWLEAKYRVAWLLHLSGDDEQARQVIRYVQATNANREENPWWKRMDHLLNEVLDQDQAP